MIADCHRDEGLQQLCLVVEGDSGEVVADSDSVLLRKLLADEFGKG